MGQRHFNRRQQEYMRAIAILNGELRDIQDRPTSVDGHPVHVVRLHESGSRRGFPRSKKQQRLFERDLNNE